MDSQMVAVLFHGLALCYVLCSVSLVHVLAKHWWRGSIAIGLPLLIIGSLIERMGYI